MLPEIVTPIPGPRSRELAATLRRYESQNVTYLAEDFPIFWQRAEGTNVWDADGNRFLDLTSAFGVSGLGHTNPQIRAALVAQSADLMHAMGDVHPTAVKAELCRQLSAMTFERWDAGIGKVVLGNSGSDAVEAALKTALLYTGKPAEAADPLSRALRERERVLTRIPSDIYPAAMLTGKALMGAGKFNEAAVAYLKALNLRPSDPMALQGRADALLGAGKAEAAKELLSKP